MVLLQILLGILLPIGALLSIMIWAFRNGIVPMPTSAVQARMIVQNLPENPGPFIYDLGSGFGTLAISLAKSYPNSTVVGVESSPIPFWFSCILRKIYRITNLSFRREDFLKTSVGDASAVIVYLYRDGVRNLKPKLEKELQPGVWILSNTFAFPEWKPVKVASVSDFNKTKIYVYRLDKINS